MYQFENYLCSTTKVAFLKFTLLFLFLLIISNTKAEDSTTLKRLDSIFNKPQIILKDTITFNDTLRKRFIKPENKQILKVPINQNDTINTTSVNKKIKKQKKIDTTYYSPKKAAIWGAAFPGLGQIYMKKYWKVPIVYGVIGAVLYFVVSNGQNLRKYNGYISNIYDSVPNPAPLDQLTLSDLETKRNGYRKNLHLASFGTVFAWGLSIVDAVVDAHLHSFDMSDKLSMKIKPHVNYSNFTYYTGIGVNLTFK